MTATPDDRFHLCVRNVRTTCTLCSVVRINTQCRYNNVKSQQFSTPRKRGLKETADKIKPRTNEQVIDCFEKSIIGEKRDDAENEKLNYIFVSGGGGIVMQINLRHKRNTLRVHCV